MRTDGLAVAPLRILEAGCCASFVPQRFGATASTVSSSLRNVAKQLFNAPFQRSNKVYKLDEIEAAFAKFEARHKLLMESEAFSERFLRHAQFATTDYQPLDDGLVPWITETRRGRPRSHAVAVGQLDQVTETVTQRLGSRQRADDRSDATSEMTAASAQAFAFKGTGVGKRFWCASEDL